MEVHGKKLGKVKNKKTEIAIQNKAKILQFGNYSFREGPTFVAKEVYYQHECTKNYLYEKYKSSNINN